MQTPTVFLLPLAAALATAALASACKTLDNETSAAPTGLIDQATFAVIDTDADGKVSLREMAVHKHREGLAELDLDNDKRISAEEWKAARPSASGDGSFARLDRNGDRFITEEEAVADLIEQQAFKEAFAKMDLDRDGKLTWEEYAVGDASSLDVTLPTD
ncbi:MAG TPA: EF-hand domain-containing protein [Bacteroidia bacterium]|nr:EF-hand domain-containing protein [Bacteroidia bacterium]